MQFLTWLQRHRCGPLKNYILCGHDQPVIGQAHISAVNYIRPSGSGWYNDQTQLATYLFDYLLIYFCVHREFCFVCVCVLFGM